MSENDWRSEITALTGGADLASMHRYVKQHPKWVFWQVYLCPDESSEWPGKIVAEIGLKPFRWARGFSDDDPTEALALAILAAVDATEGGR